MWGVTEGQRFFLRCESYVKLRNRRNASLLDDELLPLDIYVALKQRISEGFIMTKIPCESFVKHTVSLKLSKRP